MKFFNVFVCLILFAVDFCHADTPGQSIALDQDKTPISLDDMQFSSTMGKVLIPAGRTGKLILIDPSTQAMDSISGFGTQPYAGGRGAGVTSVAEAGKMLLVTDRSTHQVDVVDPQAKKIVAMSPLKSGPDYVRYVKATNEIWITEPHDETIEIFSYAQPAAKPESVTTIKVPGGPEALVIDNVRGVAYTNIDGGKTVAIDLKARKTIHEWPDGCKDGEGALLDDSGQFLFVACREGKVVSMDPASGKVISSVSSGDGIDIISYNSKLKHIYAPGSHSATIAVISVSPKGELKLVRTVPGVERGHCVVADNIGNFYVCDPNHAGLVMFKDTQ